LELLLKEYDTLREEVLARVQSRFQLLSFLVAAAAFVVGQSSLTQISVGLWWLLVGVVALVGIVWFYFRVMIENCAKRLRQIEGALNGSAPTQVMQWESRRAKSIVARWMT
jgi:hypothetical protein